MFDLRGKTALVTGASRGIGRSVALSLAQAGSGLELWGRDLRALAETRAAAAAHGVPVRATAVDVTSRADVARAVASAIADHGKIDTAVLNAGVNELRPLLEWEPEQWARLVDTNINGVLHSLQFVGRHMTERKSGSVIAMASIYSFVGAPGNSIYCLTKGGISQLARCAAIEWARFEVRVNSICPGWIETDLTSPYMQDPKVVAAGLRQIPIRRFGKPEDIGPMAVYLASDEAAWVTGQDFTIDGGQIAR
jgi:NAD(P)-dependent dehydrogenase (short-subunit alcohol dehydrogenase family)